MERLTVNTPKNLIFAVNVLDIQVLAHESIGRELDEDELEEIKNDIWYNLRHLDEWIREIVYNSYGSKG